MSRRDVREIASQIVERIHLFYNLAIYHIFFRSRFAPVIAITLVLLVERFKLYWLGISHNLCTAVFRLTSLILFIHLCIYHLFEHCLHQCKHNVVKEFWPNEELSGNA
jgi:hypothetical protein